MQAKFSVAQPRQHALAHMGDRFQLAEDKKSRRSLDGVNRPKNAGENFPVRRVFSQLHQVPVKPVQTLVAFDEKLLNNVVAVIYGASPFQSERPLPGFSTEVLVHHCRLESLVTPEFLTLERANKLEARGSKLEASLLQSDF